MTAEDVAAQLARERALKQADKMETIGRLTGAIAQQFNELLTAILARTAALAQSLPPNRDIDELKLTAQRGAELAQRLLGFSRHRVLDLQPLILTEFVRDALDTLRRQLPANIEVQFEADEEGGVVEADPAAVKQILLHLGARDLEDVADAKGMLAGNSRGQEVLKLVQRRQDVMKDAWLTATGHKRPGMKQGLSLPEARAKAAEMEKEIRNLVEAGGKAIDHGFHGFRG